MTTKDAVPPALVWKHDFLSLHDAIMSLQGRYLQWGVDYTPPSEAPENGNTAKLLHYHLDRCRELLWAEMQGGLDAEYQDEVDALTKTTTPIPE